MSSPTHKVLQCMHPTCIYGCKIMAPVRYEIPEDYCSVWEGAVPPLKEVLP